MSRLCMDYVCLTYVYNLILDGFLSFMILVYFSDIRRPQYFWQLESALSPGIFKTSSSSGVDMINARHHSSRSSSEGS